MGALVGKVALVTGGARRIGAGISERLLAEGAKVAIGWHESESAAKELAARAGDSRAIAVELDVTSDAKVKAAVESTIAKLGAIDLLVNNAAIFPAVRIDELTVEHWEGVLDLNLTGCLRTSLACLSSLRSTGGCIVNVADVYAERPLREHVAYSVSKAGVVMLTRALALELAPVVRVNAVSPGPILFPETRPHEANRAVIARTPLGRRGDPSDIAGAIVYLAGAGFVTGQVLAVDGGRSVLL